MEQPNDYIKFEIYDKQKRTPNLWYIDISKLSLTDLINLRKEISGKDINLEVVLTNIIDRETGICYNSHDSYKANRRRDQKLNGHIRKKKRVVEKKRGRY